MTPVAYRLIDSGVSKVPCATNVIKNDLITIADGVAKKTNPNFVASMPVHGIVVKVFNNYAYITQNTLLKNITSFTFDENNTIFASENVEGGMQATRPLPNKVTQKVGIAINDSDILININPNDAVLL